MSLYYSEQCFFVNCVLKYLVDDAVTYCCLCVNKLWLKSIEGNKNLWLRKFKTLDSSFIFEDFGKGMLYEQCFQAKSKYQEFSAEQLLVKYKQRCLLNNSVPHLLKNASSEGSVESVQELYNSGGLILNKLRRIMEAKEKGECWNNLAVKRFGRKLLWNIEKIELLNSFMSIIYENPGLSETYISGTIFQETDSFIKGVSPTFLRNCRSLEKAIGILSRFNEGESFDVCEDLVFKLDKLALKIKETASELFSDGKVSHSFDELSVYEKVHTMGKVLFKEFSGNESSYYDPLNSYMSFVLRRKVGIPISLSVLWILVGSRLGVEILPVSYPGHFLCCLFVNSPANVVLSDQSPLFLTIDAFTGNFVKEGEAHSRFIPGVSSFIIKSHICSFGEIISRMCRNLTSIYKRTRDIDKFISMLEFDCLLSPTAENIERRFGFCFLNIGMSLNYSLKFLKMIRTRNISDGISLMGNYALGVLENELLESLSEEYSVKPKFRKENIKFHIGDVIIHKKYNYRGVIVGYDETCLAPYHWVLQMGVNNLSNGKEQPFYNILVDNRDRGPDQTTYVAEENIIMVECTQDDRIILCSCVIRLDSCVGCKIKENMIQHKKIGIFFDYFDFKTSKYAVTGFHHKKYPDL